TARWSRNNLSYFIQNYPSNSNDMQDSKLVSETIETAFRDWSSVANVILRRTYSNKSADIRVKFARSDHSDGYPFDGKGVVLAHAFFPEDGRLHFDDDEKWSYDGVGGPNLRQVATHEIGHILGLAHSNVKGSIMFPYYSYLPKFKLSADDIKRAIYLYGLLNAL
ncbi:hypothetical protein HELRODRAFT_81292, partial [Helobdella robusta]|uniref:Peptidase metallopeptidase domain-containing protein n=1 Tax=Helobdella robusta TaxID=6412 RepID=T1G4C7_HELRO